MNKVFTHTVTSIPNEFTRLSDYLTEVFPLLTTRKSIKKALTRKEIFVNNRIGYSGDYVQIGQVIEHRKAIAVPKVETVLDIVYEDEFLIVVNKPPGIKSSGQGAATLAMALINYGNHSPQKDALLAPQLLHRLDRDTTGLLIAAKTKTALDILSRNISSGKISKEYIAIVEDIPKVKIIDNELDGKSSKTELLSSMRLNTKDETSFVRIKLYTGRTHQIRRHLEGIGCPIVGDEIYNKNGVKFGRGLFLQAVYLSFNHPITNENLTLEILPHNKFKKYLSSL